MSSGIRKCFKVRDFFSKLFGFTLLPKGIFAASLFGLFLGMSTTMIYSQLGMFLKHELHANACKIAIIDGFVECISYLTRIFSGAISDYLRNRKFILLIGCVVTLFMKPLFAIAKSSITVLLAQSIERIGNGLQACPRDALIADLSDAKTLGRSFGFNKSLKTVGSLVGSIIAIYFIYYTNNYRLLFLLATVPVVIAIVCLCKIKSNSEQDISNYFANKQFYNPFQKKHLKSLDMGFWKLMIVATIFELGHFSEALLPLRANDFVDKSLAGIASLFISAGQILLSYPIGLYADKIGKKVFIPVCMILMLLANVMFIIASNEWFVYIGAFLWGGQMTANQGVFLSLVTEKVDSHLRGTAIGIYYCVVGLSYMIASAAAGDLWDTYGCAMAFTYSASFTLLSFITFFFLMCKEEYGVHKKS